HAAHERAAMPPIARPLFRAAHGLLRLPEPAHRLGDVPRRDGRLAPAPHPAVHLGPRHSLQAKGRPVYRAEPRHLRRRRRRREADAQRQGGLAP
ncbi:hypothetical protein BN1723_020686, partial [Verticillium longisporum]